MNKNIIFSFLVLLVVLASSAWYLLRGSDTPVDVPLSSIATSTPSVASSTPKPPKTVLVGESNVPPPTMVIPTSGVNTFEGEGTVSTISDLIARGGDQICTITTNTSDVESKGMVYISGKKVRGIFTSKVIRSNIVIDSSMIQRDGFVYTWSSMMSQGFKAPVSVVAKNQVIPISDTYSFEYDQGIEYRCNNWTVDASFFELPTWVNFSTAK